MTDKFISIPMKDTVIYMTLDMESIVISNMKDKSFASVDDYISLRQNRSIKESSSESTPLIVAHLAK